MSDSTLNPFRLSSLPRPLAWTLEHILGLTPLAQRYDLRPHAATPEQFLDHTLSSLNCKVYLDGQPLAAVIPEHGPTLVFANHPYGGLEGVALTRALLAVRPDTKVLTNNMLSGISELAPVFFGVDVLAKNAAQRNASSVRAAAKHLQNNGLLLIFPAGQVSAMTWGNFSVRDRQWNPMIGRLARKYEATCVPVFVHGKNPTYFQLAGLIHKRLRTLLLPRQLTNKTGQTIRMTVGTAISPRECQSLKKANTITNLFRMSTYLLENSQRLSSAIRHDELLGADDPQIAHGLQQELDHLSDYKLLEKNQFEVYCAPYSALTEVFDAIATAREVTFRAAGEGTGNDKDTDRFDPHYYHLFVWDREAQKIVGGYRLGETDTIVDKLGVNALYSRSLYRYDANYIKNLGPALEVGRSFVTQAYQRHPSALDLLWRGIGQFVVRHPKYKVLFGCVSISSDHSETARAFISDAMMESFRAEQKFLENVQPIMPLRVKGKVWSKRMLSSIRDISVFNKLVGQCDPGKTIPVLLRHYLALNGRFVGFSVNKGFNDSLDGLILVNLHNMPERYLKRYLGHEGLIRYQQYWTQHERTV
ncbi:lysophospholipid acyltransferase family protein [Reinekea sp. G2M2-21]|uniref:lysophospholipid acyltransferase family protein n=1 Tax=Reinekea sp. G2M2-21 TaxID=2788942 RepID=UPI0018AB7322|nr:GNAT family N-acyltransferase [Reinekea sp. G2M2-21]